MSPNELTWHREGVVEIPQFYAGVAPQGKMYGLTNEEVLDAMVIGWKFFCEKILDSKPLGLGRAVICKLSYFGGTIKWYATASGPAATEKVGNCRLIFLDFKRKGKEARIAAEKSQDPGKKLQKYTDFFRADSRLVFESASRALAEFGATQLSGASLVVAIDELEVFREGKITLRPVSSNELFSYGDRQPENDILELSWKQTSDVPGRIWFTCQINADIDDNNLGDRLKELWTIFENDILSLETSTKWNIIKCYIEYEAEEVCVSVSHTNLENDAHNGMCIIEIKQNSEKDTRAESASMNGVPALAMRLKHWLVQTYLSFERISGRPHIPLQVWYADEIMIYPSG